MSPATRYSVAIGQSIRHASQEVAAETIPSIPPISQEAQEKAMSSSNILDTDLKNHLQEMFGKELIAEFAQCCGLNADDDPYLVYWLGLYVIIRSQFPDQEYLNTLSKDFFNRWLPLLIFAGKNFPDPEARDSILINRLYHHTRKALEIYRVNEFIKNFKKEHEEKEEEKEERE